MQDFRSKTQWDEECAKLLLNTYLEITKGRLERRKAVKLLEKSLSHYAFDKRMEGQSFSIVNINRQLGMLEYLMTDGKRGLMGIPLPCVKEIVKIYRKEQEEDTVNRKCRNNNVTVVKEDKEASEVFDICGQKVKKNRASLVQYAVKKYAQKQISCLELKEHYDRLLNDLKLVGNNAFEIDLHYLKHLALAPYTLWSLGGRVRYYDVSKGNYDELLETLNLKQFSDTELSTVKFFREYPDLMEKYSIHDEYELHNLLRKILVNKNGGQESDEAHRIEFKIMPIIKIGNPDREKQILKIIEEKEPVTRERICELYETMYGISAELVKKNTKWEKLERYCFHGEYRIHHNAVLDRIHVETDKVDDVLDVSKKMKNVLTEDFYTMEEFSDLYLETIPGSKIWDITSNLFHQIGYIFRKGYIIREKYKNSKCFFREKLTEGNVVDLRDKQQYQAAGASFFNALKELSSQYQIVEAKPDVFYTHSYLAELGITMREIRQFCEAIRNFVSENTFFTIDSVCKSGFLLPWRKVDLGEYFYSSILAADTEHFASVSCGGKRLLWNGKRERSISADELIMHILDETDKMLSSKELQLRVQVKYGLDLRLETIKKFAEKYAEYRNKLMV